MYRLGIHSKSALQRSAGRASGIVATAALVALEHVHSARRYTSSESSQGGSDKDNGEKKPVFDITKKWERATSEGSEYFKKWIITSKDSTEPQTSSQDTTPDESPSFPSGTASPRDLLKGIFGIKDPREKETLQMKDNDEESTEKGFASMMTNATTLILGGANAKQQEDALQNIIEQACHTSNKGDIKDTTSFSQVLALLEEHRSNIERIMQETFGHIDLSKLFPTSAYYYIEREDEVKNPSWKRMKHRFHGGVDVEQVKDLNAALYLAELSYEETVEDIQAGLAITRDPVELVYCDTDSEPNRPAHFILLKKDQSIWSSSLEVIMVVRGTRSPSDAVTDAYMEAVPYRGGLAHSGILQSGRYLVDEHKELLQKLCELSNKRKIKLTLIGHSLGAGAATIAGMEFNDIPNIDAEVIGFGCPSLLSKELSESTKSYIQTVIADSDLVPRTNGVTIGNMLLDIMEYDWTTKARRDIVHAFEELTRVAPALATQPRVDYIMSLVDSTFDSYVRPTIKEGTSKRAEAILFPPGKCIHFYRDGYGISGSESPCTFFNEIDVALTMLSDHMIDTGYRRIFLDLMRQYRRDHHFRFEEDTKK